MTDIVPSQAIQLIQQDGEILVDSRVIAKGIHVRHESFMKTILTYQSELEEFGILRFEIGVLSGPGQPQKYVMLNRNQAGIAISFSRNTKEVVQFKVGLFKAIDVLEAENLRLKEAPKETFVVLPVMDHVDTVLSLEQEWRLDVELHQMSNALHDLLRRRHFTDAELKIVIQTLAADIDKFKIVVRAQDEFLVTVNRGFVEQAGILKRLAESGAIEMLPTYPEMNHINLLAPDKPRVVQ